MRNIVLTKNNKKDRDHLRRSTEGDMNGMK